LNEKRFLLFFPVGGGVDTVAVGVAFFGKGAGTDYGVARILA